MSFFDWDSVGAENISDCYTRKIALGENISVARIEVLQWAVTQPHSHDCEELIIVLKGEWLFHLPSGDVTLRPNQMLSIPPGVEHSSEAIKDTIALDVCSPARVDWITGEDRHLHHDPDEYLWAV